MDKLSALVTGANKGIGKEIARQLAAEGHTVYVGSRDAGRGAEAVAEIGGDARPLVLDVTDAASIAAAAREVTSLDVLVNNAGVSTGVPVPVTEEDPDAFRRIYETNVFGVVAVTNAFLPALRRSAHPRIVNVSSGAASLAASAGQAEGIIVFTGRPSGALGAYRSSKTALNELTVLYANALAEEGFKVNALAPGARRTDLNGPARTSSRAGDPAEGAAGAVRLALLPDDGPSGAFLDWNGTPVPW
ncbi:MAG TPA: SDR family NAD(P)-dependent oxidoreductase [Trebonia sp.]|jgi:NAD(P)-dependent dehydrogenase (short-subunit alcohol dehydrogenase family)|nr:SDR family NAD(P)-dependent oxidoreductase [Trebonia sp.]